MSSVTKNQRKVLALVQAGTPYAGGNYRGRSRTLWALRRAMLIETSRDGNGLLLTELGRKALA